MRLSSLGKDPIRCRAAPLAGWVGADMVSGDAWSLDSISAESAARLDVSRPGFTRLGPRSGTFVVAAGSSGKVARTLQAARLDRAAVRLELEAGRTCIWPRYGGDARRGVVQVRPRLHFDAASIARVHREISR